MEVDGRNDFSVHMQIMKDLIFAIRCAKRRGGPLLFTLMKKLQEPKPLRHMVDNVPNFQVNFKSIGLLPRLLP